MYGRGGRGGYNRGGGGKTFGYGVVLDLNCTSCGNVVKGQALEKTGNCKSYTVVPHYLINFNKCSYLPACLLQNEIASERWRGRERMGPVSSM